MLMMDARRSAYANANANCIHDIFPDDRPQWFTLDAPQLKAHEPASRAAWALESVTTVWLSPPATPRGTCLYRKRVAAQPSSPMAAQPAAPHAGVAAASDAEWEVERATSSVKYMEKLSAVLYQGVNMGSADTDPEICATRKAALQVRRLHGST